MTNATHFGLVLCMKVIQCGLVLLTEATYFNVMVLDFSIAMIDFIVEDMKSQLLSCHLL